MSALNSNFTTKESSSASKGSVKVSLSKEENDKKLIERFPVLKDDRIFHNYFSSYDFRPQESNLLEFWKEVLNFVFENIHQDFAVRNSEVIDSVRLKNKKPLGINNIIVISI